MKFTQKDYDIIDKEFEGLRLLSLKRCASQEEYEGVLKAFEFANNAHNGVRRRSGEPYIIHPISVAKIVITEIGLGYKSIVAALLHDTVEDTEYTVEDIRRLFGDKIASLVDGLTKIKAAMDNEDSTNSLQAENFKRILLTLNDDVRVILIKLADRLHNLRTISSMPDRKKDKILSETMYIFIPLAHRLGLYTIKSEMEDIWLKFREPKNYEEIQHKISEAECSKGTSLKNFIAPINDILEKTGYKFKLIQRTKSPYSIWHKMQTKNVTFDEIFDIFAIRIIFEPKIGEEERVQCWYIYSLISGLYPSKTDRIRDWVTRPKNNGYEALHCTLMSKSGMWVEVQIRSKRMDAIAEKGVAAHWTYKKLSGESKNNEIDNWLAMVRDVLENTDISAFDFLDKFHESLLSNGIYVFTPKGESKGMPLGSTVLDFAFSIHSDIGLHAIAAKINRKLVPLSTKLQNGDQVEIITADSQQPQREWFDFLKTSKAKNIVYDALKDDSKNSSKEGREKLEKELAKYGVTLQNRVIKKLLPAYDVSSKDELYSKIAAGIINFNNLEKILKTNNKNKKVGFWTLSVSKSKNNAENKISNNKEYILEENQDKHTKSYQTAECCYPIPGDAVVGFLQADGKVIIHKKTCPVAINLASTDGETIVNAKWKKHTSIASLARLRIIGVDRLGIVNDVTRCMSLELNINIRKVTIETHDGIFEGFIDFYVFTIENLETLMTKLKEIRGVEEVSRVEIKYEEN